jgi:hypothetical protein
MKLNVKALSHNDYEDILVEWWKDWGWEAPPERDFLPQDGKGGVIVYDDNIPVCAGFIYSTNSRIAWITWIISNKKYKNRNKKKSLDMLISTLETISKNKGHKYMFTNNNHPALIKYFSNAGYVKGTTSTELIKTMN